MSTKTCRDCGNVLEQDARGCPRCAMNFEAEDMIERLFWRLVPSVVMIVLTIVALYFVR